MILYLLFLSSFLFSYACPEKINSIPSGKPEALFVEGDYLYFGANESLNIYYIKDVMDPKYISSIKIPGTVFYNIYVKEDYIYCALYDKGFRIIDVRDKFNPKIVSSYNIIKPYGINMIGNILYVFSPTEGIVILDVNDKKNPKLIKKITGVQVYDGEISNGYLFVAGYNFLIYSLSNAKDPIFISSTNDFAQDLKIKGNYVFYPAHYYAMGIIDISDVKNPKSIATLGNYNAPMIYDHIELAEDIAIVSGNGGTQFYDIFDINNVFLISYKHSWFNHKFFKKDLFLFSSEWDEEISIYDVTYCKNEYLYPNASFTYTPINPVAGEKVYFKNTSYPIAHKIEWDFGDGQKSTYEYPYNIFLKAGEYEVKLTASNPVGSSEYSERIIVSEGEGSPPFEESGDYKYLIPAVAHSPGANGTYWQSDITIVNPSLQTDANVNLYFIKQGDGDCNFEGFNNIKIEKREEVRLKDVVYKILGREGMGAIWVTSDIAVVPSSRTYNTAIGIGTYGQYVPAIEKEKIYKDNKGVVLSNLTWNDEYRTNIGLVNIEDEDKRFCFFYTTPEGFLCTSAPKCSWNQISLSELIDVNYGYGFNEDFLLTMGYTDGIFLYSSVIDNRTGDAIFIPEQVLH